MYTSSITDLLLLLLIIQINIQILSIRELLSSVITIKKLAFKWAGRKELLKLSYWNIFHGR